MYLLVLLMYGSQIDQKTLYTECMFINVFVHLIDLLITNRSENVVYCLSCLILFISYIMQWIPSNFVTKLGKSLRGPVTLKIPSGLEWKVELRSCNGEVWLQKGWTEFADHLSIGRGHLLLFRYEGNSRFHVVIFDKSATEIEYPTNPSPTRSEKCYIDEGHHQEPIKVKVENDIDYVEISEEDDDPALPCLPTTGNKSPLQSLRSPLLQKRMRTGSSRGLKTLSTSGKSRACDRAIAFNSENPFFHVVVKPSHVAALAPLVSLNLNIHLCFYLDVVYVFVSLFG